MTDPEAGDFPEHPHYEELDENLEERVYLPVFDEPCAAEVDCLSELRAESEWIGISGQSSDAMRNTPTSECLSEVQPDEVSRYEARAVSEEPKMEQEFDCAPSPESEDRKKRKSVHGWVFNEVLDKCCELFDDHRVSGSWKSCPQCRNYVCSLAKEIKG